MHSRFTLHNFANQTTCSSFACTVAAGCYSIAPPVRHLEQHDASGCPTEPLASASTRLGRTTHTRGRQAILGLLEQILMLGHFQAQKRLTNRLRDGHWDLSSEFRLAIEQVRVRIPGDLLCNPLGDDFVPFWVDQGSGPGSHIFFLGRQIKNSFQPDQIFLSI